LIFSSVGGWKFFGVPELVSSGVAERNGADCGCGDQNGRNANRACIGWKNNTDWIDVRRSRSGPCRSSDIRGRDGKRSDRFGISLLDKLIHGSSEGAQNLRLSRQEQESAAACLE